MALDIGRVAYERYCSSLIEQECDCDLSKWEELGQVEQNAWRHSAVAVMQQMRKEKEQSEQGLIG